MERKMGTTMLGANTIGNLKYDCGADEVPYHKEAITDGFPQQQPAHDESGNTI
jgi:hypothetical protein